MTTIPSPILYLTPFGERGGAERMLDALIRGHRSAIRQRFASQVICGTDGVFCEQLRDDGIPVTVRALRLRRLVESVRWLRRYLREHGIRLIHTSGAHYHQFAWLASRGLGVKCLWFSHGPCPKRWWKGVAHAFPADAVVTEGRFIAACHKGFTLSPPPRLIQYGLEEKWLRSRPDLRQDFRQKWGVGADETAVGILGRVERWKRQHLFLDAVAALPPNIVARCRFFVGGVPALGVGHDYYPELQRRHEQHRYRDRIALTGYVEAEPFWEGMDVAVHCAHEDPFPLVILESLAKGKLVIGANSGGVPEMITDGKNGMLHDPTDVPGLAHRIAHAVIEADQYLPLRSAAKDTIRSQFSCDRMVQEFERLYTELIDEPATSAELQELVRT